MVTVVMLIGCFSYPDRCSNNNLKRRVFGSLLSMLSVKSQPLFQSKGRRLNLALRSHRLMWMLDLAKLVARSVSEDYICLVTIIIYSDI